MTLALLVQQLADHLPLPGLSLNEQGVCQIRVEGSLTLTLEEVPGQDLAHVYAVLAPLPSSGPDREGVLLALLGGQLFGRELGAGLSFGVDEAAGEILLQSTLTPSMMDVGMLNLALGEFASWAGHWQARLGTPSGGEPRLDEGLAFVRA